MGRKKKFGHGGDAMMWRLKSCPKCGGDVFIDHDINGWYEQCLQCGYSHDLKSILEVKEQTRENRREPVVAGHHKKTGEN